MHRGHVRPHFISWIAFCLGGQLQSSTGLEVETCLASSGTSLLQKQTKRHAQANYEDEQDSDDEDDGPLLPDISFLRQSDGKERDVPVLHGADGIDTAAKHHKHIKERTFQIKKNTKKHESAVKGKEKKKLAKSKDTKSKESKDAKKSRAKEWTKHHGHTKHDDHPTQFMYNMFLLAGVILALFVLIYHYYYNGWPTSRDHSEVAENERKLETKTDDPNASNTPAQESVAAVAVESAHVSLLGEDAGSVSSGPDSGPAPSSGSSGPGPEGKDSMSSGSAPAEAQTLVEYVQANVPVEALAGVEEASCPPKPTNVTILTESDSTPSDISSVEVKAQLTGVAASPPASSSKSKKQKSAKTKSKQTSKAKDIQDNSAELETAALLPPAPLASELQSPTAVPQEQAPAEEKIKEVSKVDQEQAPAEEKNKEVNVNASSGNGASTSSDMAVSATAPPSSDVQKMLKKLPIAIAATEADVFLPIEGVKTTYQILVAGKPDAPIVEVGDFITVHATGTMPRGKQFWSTKDTDQEVYTYTAGGGVITGWDKGARGMKEFETRMLHIPADEGYGDAGFPAWGIPAGCELKFELEVLKIEKKEEEPEVVASESPAPEGAVVAVAAQAAGLSEVGVFVGPVDDSAFAAGKKDGGELGAASEAKTEPKEIQPEEMQPDLKKSQEAPVVTETVAPKEQEAVVPLDPKEAAEAVAPKEAGVPQQVSPREPKAHVDLEDRLDAMAELKELKAQAIAHKALEAEAKAAVASMESLEAQQAKAREEEEAAEKAFKRLPYKARNAAAKEIGEKNWPAASWRARLAAAEEAGEDPPQADSKANAKGARKKGTRAKKQAPDGAPGENGNEADKSSSTSA